MSADNAETTLADELSNLAEQASNAPWKVDTLANVGDNWLIGFGCGADDNGGDHDWIITTDCVRASEFTGCGAMADAQLVVALRNNLPTILAALSTAQQADEVERLREAYQAWAEEDAEAIDVIAAAGRFLAALASQEKN